MTLTRLLKNIGKPYMKGEDVKEVQRRLSTKGFVVEIDGYYGPATEKAVKAFQKAYGLKADGIVGKITWGALVGIETVPDTAQALCEWVLQHVNRAIYVLGSQGQKDGEITEAWIKRREHNKAYNYNRAIALWKKRLKAGIKPLFAFDCSGLIIKHLNDTGRYKGDTTANGLFYNLCSAINRTDLKAGDLVFKKSTKVYHVGVYIGDGTVVHSKGRDDGVIRESINKTNWNRYGRLEV